MIDKDGIERPDITSEHMKPIRQGKRKMVFDESYSFRPRNIFFRIWCVIFRALAIMVFNPYMVFKRRLYSFGNENRKKMRHKAFVITCNHVHLFDDLSVGTNVFAWRKIYFTTLEQNIRNRSTGFFLRSLGGIPIPSSSLSGMKKFNEDLAYLLKKKNPILFNPEASLWPFYREIRPFKRGAFQTAVKNDVPLLPIVALFKRKKKRNGKFSYQVYFAICTPIVADKTIADDRQRSEKLMNDTYSVCKRVAEEWYAIQDCGFDDEIGLPKLKIKDLDFVNDQWILKKR